MKTRVLGWVVGAVFMAAAGSAQETSDEAEARPEAPTRHIKVLHHPYDLASFYRSSQSDRPAYFGGPVVEAPSRYPIASFYRQGGGQGRYSRFWTSPSSSDGGYGRGFTRRGRSRRIGPAELCLFAPTFLAPAVPFAADLDR